MNNFNLKKNFRHIKRTAFWLKKKGRSKIPSAFMRDNIIFVHVPKAAGSTISLCLFGYRTGHRSIESFWRDDPAFTEHAFKFSFVRHPYFRFVSAYHYLLNGGMSHRDAEHSQRYPREFASLRSFAEASEQADFRQSIFHLRPQWEFLSLPANACYKVFMDYVGKTEFFNEHIDLLNLLVPEPIGARLALVKENRLNSSTPSSCGIDKYVFSKILSIYQDDFEMFGYDEYNTIEKAGQLIAP